MDMQRSTYCEAAMGILETYRLPNLARVVDCSIGLWDLENDTCRSFDWIMDYFEDPANLPDHADRHEAGGADQIQGQNLLGLQVGDAPQFAGMDLTGDLDLNNNDILNVDDLFTDYTYANRLYVNDIYERNPNANIDIYDTLEMQAGVDITAGSTACDIGTIGNPFGQIVGSEVVAQDTAAGFAYIWRSVNRQAAAVNVGSMFSFQSTGAYLTQARLAAAWEGAATTDAYFKIDTRRANAVTEAWRVRSTGVLAANQDGAVGTPLISWIADPDTGIYRIGANNFGFATNGAKIAEFTTAGFVIANTKNLLFATDGGSDIGATASRSGDDFSDNHVSGRHNIDNVLSPAQITSSQDDYNPAGLDAAGVLRLDVAANVPVYQITGITAPTTNASGKILLVWCVENNGGGGVDLMDDDASSAAANRMLLGSDINVNEGGPGVMLWYDNTSSRWRLVGKEA